MARRDYLDFLPLYPNEDEATVRQRWNDWANEALDPQEDADLWTDTREGSMFHICTQPGVRESARTYDLMGTEVVAAAVPLYSWGEYLDDHGEVRNILRHGATAATGSLTFTGTPGTIVDAGHAVTTTQTGTEEEPPSFATDAEATVEAGGTVVVPATATVAGSQANLAANALTQLEGAIPGITGVTNATPTAGGTDPESDESFAARILDQFRDTGSANIQSYRSWAGTVEGVGRVTVIPLYAGASTVLVVPMTADGQPVSQATVDALQLFLDPPAAETTLRVAADLPDATVEVISTASFKEATVAEPLKIRVGDQLVQYTGADEDSFTGTTGGVGAFPIGTRVTQGGRGGGQAPIGHHVMVKTGTLLPVDVVATVELESNFTLSGVGGTTTLAEELEAAVRAYTESVEPGSEVVRMSVVAALMSIPGVHDVDVATVTLNGAAVNLPTTAEPPQIPFLDDLALTEGSV